MAIVFSRKLLQYLENVGLNKSALRNDVSHDGLIRPSVLYKLFDKNRASTVTTDTISRLCQQLHCQPGDIMEYVPDSELSSMGLYFDLDEIRQRRSDYKKGE